MRWNRISTQYWLIRKFGYQKRYWEGQNGTRIYLVSVSMNGCLSLCVSPAMNWRPVQGVRCPRSVSAGIVSSPPCDPAMDKGFQIMNG